MKKRTIQFLGLVEVTILLSALFLFVLSNPNSLHLFVKYTTKELGLTYGKVSGNLLKTVVIEDIRYKKQLLSKKAVIDWNFKALLEASLKIDQIRIEALNIPLTQKWVEDLHHRFGNKSKKSSLSNIPNLEISELVFSASPFKMQNINVNRIELQANKIKGDLRHIDIGFFSFFTQNNYANITALGHLKKSKLSFEKLWLEKIDVKRVVKLYKELRQNTISSNKKTTKQKAKFVHFVEADEVAIEILPLDYGKYQIHKTTLKLQNLTSNLKRVDAKKILLDSTTNIWKFTSQGEIKDSTLYTKVDLTLNDRYFKRFVPFFNYKNIKPIRIDLLVNTHHLHADAILQTNNLLIKKYQWLKLSLPQVNAHVDFNFTTVTMDTKIDATLKSLYTPKALLDARLYFHKDGFTYDGILTVPKFTQTDPKLQKLLTPTKIAFYGSSKKVTAHLNSPYLYALYDGESYKKAVLQITSKSLAIKDFFPKLPSNLNETTTTIHASIPIVFGKLFPLPIDYNLTSNLFNIEGKSTFGKTIQTKATLTRTKNSLLKKILPNLKEQSLFPIHLLATNNKNKMNLTLQSRYLKTNAKYDFNTSYSKTIFTIQNQPLIVEGNILKDFNITLKSPSLRELQTKLNTLYTFTKLPADAEFQIQAQVTNLQQVDTLLKSKWFVYEYTPNHFMFAEKIYLNAMVNQKKLLLKNYYFSTYLDRDRIFFSNRPSTLKYTQKRVTIQPFWINDAIKTTGYYIPKKQTGLLHLFGKNYHYNDLEGNFYFDTDLKISLQPKTNAIEGEIVLNKGTITYEHRKSHYVQDDDIIILQKQKEKEKTPKSNLSLDVSIHSKIPIRYKVQNTDVKLDIDLKIWKEPHKNLELLGIVKVLDGLYKEGEKEFELEPGEIFFGGEALNPYLNLQAIYKNPPYTITISVNGQLDAPILNFTSTPYLTQSDILSLLLFDSTTSELLSSNQDASSAAITMFGNTFAKEVVKNFGIKLDKLALITTQEGKIGLEIGKKISKKITLIYINDIVQTIKIRYKISDHVETDFTFSPDNSGVDIIYKDEY